MDINQIMASVTKAIETTYFQHLALDYAGWLKPGDGTADPVCERMIQEFKDGLSYTIGRNYIKVVTDCSSVHSFIVIRPTKKGFKIGDILKAASWNAPATNFKRGNVFELSSLPGINWTGC